MQVTILKKNHSMAVCSREEILKIRPLIIAGPCAVESRQQILSIAKILAEQDIKVMRCQLWKPRTDKTSFQGVGLQGLPWLQEIKEKFGLLLATEVVDTDQIKQTQGIVDILWVGARNMQNFELLKNLGEDTRVVILKRGFIATVKEWIAAATYIGRDRVILCERGIRTGADSMRFTLDINSALVAKHDFDMPVIIDPSHTCGRADMVPHLAYSAIASGITGLVVEVHSNPEDALSDKHQQITPEVFLRLCKTVRKIHTIIQE